MHSYISIYVEHMINLHSMYSHARCIRCNYIQCISMQFPTYCLYKIVCLGGGVVCVNEASYRQTQFPTFLLSTRRSYPCSIESMNVYLLFVHLARSKLVGSFRRMSIFLLLFCRSIAIERPLEGFTVLPV